MVLWAFSTCFLVIATLNGCYSTGSTTYDPKKLIHVDYLRWRFFNLEENLWNFIEKSTRGNKDNKNPEVSLIRQYEEFGDKIFKVLPYDLTHGLESLNNFWPLQLIYVHLRSISTLYEKFSELQKQTEPEKYLSQKQSWTDLAEAILYNPMSNVEDLLEKIGNINVKIYDEVKQEVEENSCNYKQLPQQVLYHLYNTIALTELKGYIMIQFSYMFLNLYNQGNFSLEAQVTKNNFEERATVAIVAVKKRMKDLPRELWNCDPKIHIKDETYIEVTRLLQGYIQNEVYLNNEKTCRDECPYYTFTKYYEHENTNLHEQRCHGNIIQCQFFDSNMRICLADVFGGRRYQYIQFENGKILGKKQSCTKGIKEADSWNWWFWECSFCFCLCDEQGIHSDRYFNMRPTFSDINNNKVVTGLKFVRKNRIIHLQIQEGKLLPRGDIDIETVHWIPVDDYKITDRKVYSGQDYHILDWRNRGFDLDNLAAEEGYVLTGVRFKTIGTHLNFEIYTTKFEFDTGKLISSVGNSKWIDNINTIRTKVGLSHPDIPIKSALPSVPTSKHDQYIIFENSDIVKDVAQTTVPFLDAQKVESLIPFPLSGAGIFHKGRSGSGGFITPKIIIYDFSKHLKVTTVPEEA